MVSEEREEIRTPRGSEAVMGRAGESSKGVGGGDLPMAPVFTNPLRASRRIIFAHARNFPRSARVLPRMGNRFSRLRLSKLVGAPVRVFLVFRRAAVSLVLIVSCRAFCRSAGFVA